MDWFSVMEREAVQVFLSFWTVLALIWILTQHQTKPSGVWLTANMRIFDSLCSKVTEAPFKLRQPQSLAVFMGLQSRIQNEVYFVNDHTEALPAACQRNINARHILLDCAICLLIVSRFGIRNSINEIPCWVWPAADWRQECVSIWDDSMMASNVLLSSTLHLNLIQPFSSTQ